jgi:hypothetical protein
MHKRSKIGNDINKDTRKEKGRSERRKIQQSVINEATEV